MAVLLFGACSSESGGNSNASRSNVANANANASAKAPTPDKEVTELAKKNREERLKAIKEFIEAKHSGWSLGGVEQYEDFCNYGTPCDLHLVKGKQNKVVSVVVKSFENTDGTTYTIAYETRSVDLSQQRIEDLKQGTIENFREGMELSDCDRVIEENEDTIYAMIRERHLDQIEAASDYDPSN